VTANVVEELGAESHVIFPIDAPRVLIEPAEADADEGRLLAGDQRAMFTACVDGHREVSIGDTVDLAVNNTRLHFFDPETHEVLGAVSQSPTRSRVS